MRDNSNGHKLLAVVPTVHHQRVGQALDDWALGFSESLRSISAGRVGDVDRSADLNVVTVESSIQQGGSNGTCTWLTLGKYL